MTGLVQLKQAKPYDIKFEYKALPKCAQIHYMTEYPPYAQALHEGFDAQEQAYTRTQSAPFNAHRIRPPR